MPSYQNFMGIDIGKFSFVVSLQGASKIHTYDNTPEGIFKFLEEFQEVLPTSLVVLETTGGYEMQLLLALCEQKYAVHRANTRKVKNFIRSFGSGAKTDALDAKALSLYGAERHSHLDLFKPLSEKALALYELIQRRQDLTQMLVAEKNRQKAPKYSHVAFESYQQSLDFLTRQIDGITAQMKALVKADEALLARYEVLLTLPGVGEINALKLLAFMPELGSLSSKQAASLAGLAPLARDSGCLKGYRRTAAGRHILKPFLFLSAMAAGRSHSPLGTFYQSLLARGKKKKVALIAVARKIIVIANARLRDANLVHP